MIHAYFESVGRGEKVFGKCYLTHRLSHLSSQTCIKLLRIDTGAWDVIGVIVYISCSPLHKMTCYISYERSIFFLFNYTKQEDIN